MEHLAPIFPFTWIIRKNEGFDKKNAKSLVSVGVFDLGIGKFNETPEATFSHLPELSDIFALGMGIGIGVKWRLDGRWIGIRLEFYWNWIGHGYVLATFSQSHKPVY